jgi:hypothetical protein
VGELRVERDERVSLELGQGDVLGVEGVGPSELVSDLPGEPIAYLVVEGHLICIMGRHGTTEPASRYGDGIRWLSDVDTSGQPFALRRSVVTPAPRRDSAFAFGTTSALVRYLNKDKSTRTSRTTSCS